ncbi:MAG: MFS transporter [Candidatus Limnocylindrales bacterium]
MLRARLTIPALGVATIAAYGAAYYAYGVLIGPIAASTGWSATMLGAIFSAVLVTSGLIGVVGGRLLDRSGPRPLLLVTGTLGAGLLATAPLLEGYLSFALVYGTACGLIGGLGFYHVAQPAAARSRPADPASAIVQITIIGVFCSPIYLPATAWLVGVVGWRGAIEVHAAIVAVVFCVAAIIVRVPLADPAARTSLEPPRAVLRGVIRDAAIRRWIIATLISGAATDVLLVYQVPAMSGAGLPLAAAATIAGARGFAQLAGRLPLTPIVRRFGTRRAIVVAHVVAAAGSLLLIASGSLVGALAYSLLAGASLGSLSALQGIYTHELIDARHLGMLFGAQQALYGIGGAAGPLLAGVLLDATGSFPLLLVGIAAAFAIAAAILAAPAARRLERDGSYRSGHA